MDSTTASPRLNLIAALDENALIGREGGLPWHLPADLRHFKALTMGKTMLMGRKTWDSLGRALPGRESWVLTRADGFAAEGARVLASLDEALAAAGGRELMVIGGAEIYRQTLPWAQRLYLTRVHARVEGGDAYFPAFDPMQWRETSREAHPPDERHAYPYSFLTLERR